MLHTETVEGTTLELFPPLSFNAVVLKDFLEQPHIFTYHPVLRTPRGETMRMKLYRTDVSYQ